jgi:hypothetical protein
MKTSTIYLWGALFFSPQPRNFVSAHKIQTEPVHTFHLYGAVQAVDSAEFYSLGEASDNNNKSSYIAVDHNCTSSSFPFTFYDANGQPVDGVSEHGICIFPESNCGVDAIDTGRVGNCCSPAPDSVVTGGNYMFIAFAFIFVPVFFIKKYLSDVWEMHPILEETIGDGDHRTPRWIKNTFLKPFSWIWKWGIWVGITALVVVPTQMKPSIQQNLNVNSRNVLQGAEAFLIPYKEVFQFVEDIVNVKINYALNSGDFEAVNSLVHLEIAGSLLTGVFASGLASVLGAIPSVLLALTNPGIDTNVELYKGCDIVAAGLNVHDITFTYWVIQVWKFVGTQVNMVLAGFMFGAFEFATAGWLMAVGIGAIPLIWFTGLSTSIDPLILLAWAEFSQPYATLILSVLYLITPLGSTIRDHTGVSLSIYKLCQSFRDLFRLGRSRDDEELCLLADPECIEGGIDETSASDTSAATLAKEGMCIMAVDLAVQLSKSLAIYLALATDAATAYQLTALDSYLPSYGIAWTLGMASAFKVFGTAFLSIKEYGYFFKLVRLYLICAFLVIPLILGTTLPKKFEQGLALSSGQNACEYAHSSQCVQFFTNVYGANAEGGDFTQGAAIESLFIVVRAMIITLLDFRYMLQSTVVAMIFYSVAIVVACLVQPFAKQADSFWIAMYIPQLVLVLLFLGRLHTLSRRMVKGDVKGELRNRFKQKLARVARFD